MPQDRQTTTRRNRRFGAVMLVLAMVAAACGSADGSDADADAGAAGEEGLSIVVSTNVLGDVVENVAGDAASVEALLPIGADPHDYQPSSQQVAAMENADLVVVNGLLLEEGLVDVLEGIEADGANVFEVAPLLDPLPFGAHGHDHEHAEEGEHSEEGEHAEEGEHEHAEDGEHEHAEDGEHEEGEHAEEGEHEHAEDGEHDEGEHEEGEHEGEHADEASPGAECDPSAGHSHDEEEDGHDGEEGHDHAEGSCDPHVWMDPLRMAEAARLVADELAELDPDTDWSERAEAYASELEALDAEIEGLLADVPDEERVLVTNHEAFGYFADRYGFEVVGVVIPGGSTLGDPSSAELSELVEVMADEGVRVVFAETTNPSDLGEAVAGELGDDVAVVELYTGSLGEPGSGADSYIGMMRTNAELIADALGA